MHQAARSYSTPAPARSRQALYEAATAALVRLSELLAEMEADAAVFGPDADLEPSLGAGEPTRHHITLSDGSMHVVNPYDQTRWADGDRTDAEEQCEGEGEQCEGGGEPEGF